MAILTFTIGGYLILFRICLPFDIYRVATFIAVSIIGVVLVVIDRFSLYPNLEGKGFFQIDYFTINGNNWWLLLAIIGAAIPLYVGIETIFSRLYEHKIKSKHELKGSMKL